MKIKKNALNLLRILLVMILLIVCFSAAFYITTFVYEGIGKYPSALLVQIMNSFIGSGLALLLFLIISKSGVKKVEIFKQIIRAQEEIARGDFNVKLDNDYEDKGPIGELMKSVNNMAVELSQMEKMRQEFISNVSHEIQSPITSIRGFALALKDDKVSAEDKLHYIGIIETESIRMSKLCDNLLKLASLEAETIRFEPKPYRLDKQIINIILACEPQWLEKNIDMEVSLEELTVKADEDMMSQVWINLIHNSIKFTPNDGTVKVNLHKRGEQIEFKISDTGIGISQEEQIHVFDRFYKADKARQRSKIGSGLGLSITKKIIDMHNGTITVQSKLDEGATFTVSIPNS